MVDEAFEERLESWKEIAAFLNRDVRTVQRWEKSEGLPVHRHHHDKQGSVYASRAEIAAWRDRRSLQPPGAEPADLPHAPGDGPASRAHRWRSRAAFPVWVLAAAILAGGGLATWRALAGGRPGGPALAVLPFTDLDGGADQRYFSDGFTEELITQLGRQEGEGGRVVALHSALGYRNTQKRPSQVARELGVDYLLEGTLRRSGDRVRLTVHLIRGTDEVHVWDKPYEGELQDLISLQREVADAIASEISLKLVRGRTQPRPVKPEAYMAYLQGRFYWNRRTPQDLYRALGLFQEAARLDPGFAPTQVGIADCYALLGSAEFGILAPREAMPQAKAAVGRALELDPGLAEAHASLGHIRLVFDWDWKGADQAFRRAIALNPGYATAHQWYALYHSAMGQSGQALEELRHAEALDPRSPAVQTALAEGYYFARRYGEAEAAARKALELDPGFLLGYLNLGRALDMEGRHAEAVGVLQRGWELSGHAPGMALFLGHAYAAKGNRGKALALLQALEHPEPVQGRTPYIPALYIAGLYEGLGDTDGMFRHLSRALDERCEYLIYLNREPMADPMRQDPRFKALVKAVGLG